MINCLLCIEIRLDEPYRCFVLSKNIYLPEFCLTPGFEICDSSLNLCIERISYYTNDNSCGIDLKAVKCLSEVEYDEKSWRYVKAGWTFDEENHGV